MVEGQPSISSERKRQRKERPEYSYGAAIAVWFVPPLIAGAFLARANLQVYKGVATLDYNAAGAGLQWEERSVVGWPSIMASKNPSSNKWELDSGGFFTDIVGAILVVYILSIASGHLAKRLHREVIQKFKRRIRRRISGKAKEKRKSLGLN